MIAGAAATVLDRRTADIAAAEHETDALSVVLAEQTNLTFGGAEYVLNNLLERIAAAGVASPEALAVAMATPEVQRMLHDEVAGLGQVDLAGIIDAEGRLINTSDRWPVADVSLADRDFFKAMRDVPTLRSYVGAPVLSRITRQTVIPLTRRINAPDGRFLGIVLCSVRLDYFENLYRAVSEGEGRRVRLQRRDGTLLVRYPQSILFPRVMPESDPIVSELQSGASLSQVLVRSPLTGDTVLRVARALKEWPLVVVVVRTEASILANWRRQTLAVCIGVGVVAMALILGLMLLVRQINRRVVSEAVLAVTLDNMMHGIQMIDANGRVQVYNKRALEILDLPSELMAGKPSLEEVLRYLRDHGEFSGAGANEAVVRLLLSNGMDGVPKSYERQRPNGTILEINSIPLQGGGVVRTFADVTVARMREAALQAALTARDEAERALRQHAQDMEQNLEQVLADRTRALAASEARHRDTANVSCDWIWEIDLAQRLMFVSKRFGDASGLRWDQVSGLPLSGLLALGFDPAGLEALCANINAGGAFQDVIHRIDLESGRTHFWMLSGKPFADPGTGLYAGYRCTGTDVTVRIEREEAMNAALSRAEAAEREARRATMRLTEAIEAIPEGFVLNDADDRLVLCNTRYAEFYQLSPETRAPGVPFADILRAKAFAPGASTAAKVLEARLARHRLAGGNREDQHLANGRWLQVSEQRTSDGGTVGIRIDVTEARQREAADRNREKLAALGHLAGGVAHEINNLLQPALALSDLVRDSVPADDADAHEALDCVLDSTRKMRDIVRSILLFARKEEPTLASLDLVTEVRASLDFVAHLMPSSVVIRLQDLEAHAGGMVAANRTQLTQVLTNLLVNAAQATNQAGSVTVSLAKVDPAPQAAADLGVEAGRSYLTVSVSDTGGGMDEATQARIFEPFFTTKPVGVGTGLGLSVAYGILRSWHGAITVTSAPGAGATFVLYIPAI
jgi:signal transduction histidine kinase